MYDIWQRMSNGINNVIWWRCIWQIWHMLNDNVKCQIWHGIWKQHMTGMSNVIYDMVVKFWKGHMTGMSNVKWHGCQIRKEQITLISKINDNEYDTVVKFERDTWDLCRIMKRQIPWVSNVKYWHSCQIWYMINDVWWHSCQIQMRHMK